MPGWKRFNKEAGQGTGSPPSLYYQMDLRTKGNVSNRDISGSSQLAKRLFRYRRGSQTFGSENVKEGRLILGESLVPAANIH